MRGLILALMLTALPAAGWECREELWEDRYDDKLGETSEYPVSVGKHFDLASDVLFGRSNKAWLQDGSIYVEFEIFEALKGQLEGVATIDVSPYAGPKLAVGWNYVVALFDAELDICSMVFQVPLGIDSREQLREHANRTDYSKNNARLQELLAHADSSH